MASREDEIKAKNRRTGMWVAVLAAVFFAALFVKRTWFM
ncbi:cytochrome oxidase small assembly protein [Massilia sp. W12]